jgi:hypothetical protein
MKLILTSIVTSSLLAALAIAQPKPRYDVIDLGAVGVPTGGPYAIANNGLVGGAAISSGAMRAVIWYKGTEDGYRHTGRTEQCSVWRQRKGPGRGGS